MVAMRDGTKLATDYYVPGKDGPQFPTLLARSTYGRSAGDVEDNLARGYAVVIQDVRGFGQSEGEHNVFFADGWREGLQDGADTVAWIRAQPWSNGVVGTFGASALGITQILLAPAVTVQCQTIVVANSNFYGFMSYQGGVWRKCLCEGWMKALKLEATQAAFKSHPCYDEFWSYYNAEAQTAKIGAPALHIGGWFDIFQQGTIDSFVTRQTLGGEGARGNQRLIITPVGHGNYSSGCAYTLPANFDAVHVSEHQRAFEDRWLMGKENEIMDLPPVLYYVLGDDKDPDAPGMEWRYADTWPPFSANATLYYLAPDGVLTPEAPGTEAVSAAFTYDPANPFPTHGGQNLLLPLGPFDQREVNTGRTDLLKFSTAPLTEPMEITGHVTVKLYVSTDVPDTDFTAKLVDIFPAGDDREILMLDNIQRVKFRNGFTQPAPLLTGQDEVVEVEIDLWSISWVFNTGHRIGLQISGGNYPRFEKNPNTGEDWPTETNLRVAHDVVHMGRAHPSAVVLPVRPADVVTEPAERLNPRLVRAPQRAKHVEKKAERPTADQEDERTQGRDRLFRGKGK
jgi:hypothetical protein